MYLGGGYYELMNGKLKLNVDEIKELLDELYYYGIISDITQETKAMYERKIETLKKKHKTTLQKLKK